MKMSIICTQIGRDVLFPLSREKKTFTDTGVTAGALASEQFVQSEGYR